MKKIEQKNLLFFIAIILILVILHFLKVLSPLEKIATSIINPFSTKIYSVSSDIRMTYGEQSKKSELLEVIKELEQKNSQLLAQQAESSGLQEENESLRKHLDFLRDRKEKYVLANIISQELLDYYNRDNKNVLINRGRDDGVYPGLVVLDQGGAVVGKVMESKNTISSICLVNNSNCRFAASLQNEDKTVGITNGDLGLTTKMDLIPQLEKVEKGDLVVTSGLERDIPHNLVIGEVVEVKNSSNEVWQQAIIQPMINLKTLRIVSVLIP